MKKAKASKAKNSKTTKKVKTMKNKPAEEKTVLILRSVDKDGKAYGGFQWPKEGPVSAPDWDPYPDCGNGLHGWLRGEGDATVASFSWMDSDFPSRLWQVVEVIEDEIVQLDGKVKFPRGNVLFTGSQEDAVKKIQEAYPGAAVIGARVTAGSYGTATAGEAGILVLRYYDGQKNRYRLVVGYVGEDGIEAGKKYRLNDKHEIVEAP